jgi:pimeloyl-ACP methyl ester carboxylesterase
MTAVAQRVTSSDGTELAVYETGERDAPTILAVHGYPDNHAVWDGFVGQLADRYHVVTYDVRGAGASEKPAAVAAYRMPQLLDDLFAVADAVSPGEPVHLVAHDWGSIQSWAAVTDEQRAGRVATLTSISGPSLDYAAAWLRQLRGHPRDAVRQLAHSYYIALFQLPRLPELAIGRGLFDRGLPADHQCTRDDQLHGLRLYRANMLGRLTRPRPVRAELPVQVIVPERDPFVTPALAIGAPRPWVPDLTVRRVPAGHWVISKDPAAIATLVDEFVAAKGSR